MNLFLYFLLLVISTSSHVATTAYLKYYNFEEPAENKCFSIKSITISIVAFVIGYFSLILSIMVNIVNETFPAVVLFFISVPIVILILYVVKESNFTYPLILKLVKIIFCYPISEMEPDQDLDNNSGGIYIGPPKNRDLDNSTGGIYNGPPGARDLDNSTGGIHTGPPGSRELTHVSE